MKSNIELDRRKVLGTVGGLALAGSGLAAFTGSAAAQVSTSFTANDAGTVTTADGSIQQVLVDTSGTFSWSGLDSAATTGMVTLEAKKKGSHPNNYAQVTSKSHGINGLSGERDFTLDQVDLTETFGDDHFESDADGEKKTTGIDLRISVTITTTGGSAHDANAADTMYVGADNEAADANINGQSDASASSYDQKYTSGDGQISVEVDYTGPNGNPRLNVVTPDAFPKPSGYTETHVELFLDAPSADGTWDIQVRRDSEEGFSYQVNGGNWKTDFSAVPLSVSATENGFVVVYTGSASSGDTYGLGAHQTTVDQDADTSVTSLTKTGSGRPWDANNLIEDQVP